MARTSMRAPLVLTDEQRAKLHQLSGSREAPLREVERAKVLLGYAGGTSITELQRRLDLSRPKIYRYVDKALAAGVEAGLKDKYYRPRASEISDGAKAWVVAIACTKPKDHDLAAELWSISALARFVSEHAESAGHARLSNAGKSTIWRILDEHEIKPHKIRYYLEKRDTDFDRKMQDIGLTATDLSPVLGKEANIACDYEYVRHSTVSILSGNDLHSGYIFTDVEDRHRSAEFVGLLKKLDEHYPSEAIIRVVLDNHSAHISKETKTFLASRPGRFEYVHTPKHGSWLNLIECAFSKMARTFLRHIRVKSKDELKDRILKGIAEFNAAPVVFQWNKFDLGVA